MAYRIRDLIFTIVPRGLAEDGSGSGGCAACSDAGSATVGSCTSECNARCADSGEMLELSPYTAIDPAFALEVRQLLTYALAKSGLKGQSVKEIEKQMRPATLQQAEALEARLKTALHIVHEERERLERRQT